MKKARLPLDASPFKSLTEELDELRKTFRTVCRHYGERVDRQILQLRERVAAAQAYDASAEVKEVGDLPSARVESEAQGRFHDLRDMLTVLRTLEIKPVAGKRRDLKKIEGAVEDLRMLIERWG